jgi:hypothetical protein
VCDLLTLKIGQAGWAEGLGESESLWAHLLPRMEEEERHDDTAPTSVVFVRGGGIS